jgi:hypothetical protein
MNGYYDGEEYLILRGPVQHREKRGTRTQPRYYESSFACRHCGAMVSANPLLSGVQHRNHCPYCLWSLHVDLVRAGDRLSACRGGMRPIGLTLKESRNKYHHRAGELMLAHRCALCNALSINRIAADDSTALIVSVYRSSLALSVVNQNELADQQIQLLGESEADLVMQRLYGKEVRLQ